MDKQNDTIILQKFKGDSYKIPDYATEAWKSENTEKICSALIIDVETTGLSYAHDQIIEIALLPFSFNKEDGRIIELKESYSSFNELQADSEPLSEFVTQLTGITEDDLKDQSIDWEKVNSIFKETDLIIAHNAKFDRPFIDLQSLVSKSKIWGCSMSQIDWMKKGFKTRGLELLGNRHGFFVDAHQALSDTEATLHLISHTDESTGKTYLSELLENVKTPQIQIEAVGAPFESKDLLKRRQYRWSPEKRLWSKLLSQSELESEKEWLGENVYNSPSANRSQAFEVSLKDTFKV